MKRVLTILFLICAGASTAVCVQQSDGDKVALVDSEDIKARSGTLKSFDKFPESKPSRFPVGKPGLPPYSVLSPSEAEQSASFAADLAMKLNNPVSSLPRVPFESNFDHGAGSTGEGFRYTLNFQPVITLRLKHDWNLISRTITPVIYQSDVIGTTTKAGLGDTTQSFFFSQEKIGPLIWGVGPALLLPTATDEQLGTGKFGVGPALVILKQHGGWTYGSLLHHIWSVAGDDARSEVNATFIQPTLSYTTRSAWTFSLNAESTYDWEAGQWSIPIHPSVSKLVTVGKQPLSLGAGLRCWAATTSNGPEGCGFRILVTPVFPKA